MKITYAMTMASALVLAAGCAHEEQSMRTGETYSSGRMSDYNQNNYAAPSVGGSYSADGAYSSGGGGYSSTPVRGNYSGTVGADGSYTPAVPAASPLTGGAFAGGGNGSDSNNAMVQRVRESLRQDPEISVIAANIQISAHNGAIILNGFCQSEEQKHKILDRALKVTGVVAVNNQLSVMAGPAGENSNNSQLAPTGISDSDRLYKDAATGQDASTNNALNSTSRQNAPTQIYQESTNSNDSVPNGNSQIYQTNPGENTRDTNSVQPMP